jgi:hypothetical protein
MGLLKFVLSLTMLSIFLYFTITGVQRYMDAQENLKVAQQEYDVAVVEAEQAQKEFQNVVKYNCANPVISSGGVSCPNG